MTDIRAQFGTMPETLEQKTGKSLDEWLGVVRASGLSKHGQIMAEMKTKHGLSHGYANMIALLSTGYGKAAPDELVEAMFAGSKAGLRPIYDRLMEGRPVLWPARGRAQEDDGDLPPKQDVRVLHALVGQTG